MESVPANRLVHQLRSYLWNLDLVIQAHKKRQTVESTPPDTAPGKCQHGGVTVHVREQYQ